MSCPLAAANYFGSADSRLTLPTFQVARRAESSRSDCRFAGRPTGTRWLCQRVEIAMIWKYRSNDPRIGYNRRPRFDVLGSLRWPRERDEGRARHQNGDVTPFPS